MKSVTDHLAISSSFTASYPIADSSHFFSPDFLKGDSASSTVERTLFKLVNSINDGASPKTIEGLETSLVKGELLKFRSRET